MTVIGKKFKQAALLCSLTFLGRLPYCIKKALAKIVGFLIYLFPNELRRIAFINLHICYPKLSNTQLKKRLKQTLTHAVMTGIEIADTWTRSPKSIVKNIESIVGYELVQNRVLDQNSDQASNQTSNQKISPIFICPHLGNWEIVNFFLAEHFPMSILYKPPKKESLEPIITHARERLGTEMLPTDSRGVRMLYRSLKSGRAIGILPDQDPGQNGCDFAPFYGENVATMTLVSKLAQKSKMPVFVVYAKRNLKTGKHILTFFSANPKLYNLNTQISLTALNKDMMKCIEDAPEQYQWTYKRFKQTQSGELSVYDR